MVISDGVKLWRWLREAERSCFCRANNEEERDLSVSADSFCEFHSVGFSITEHFEV